MRRQFQRVIEPNRIVIFFDGYCHLCNQFVDWIARQDKKKLFYFAPLQGQFASSVMPVNFKNNLNNPYSVIVRTDSGDFLEKSTAALYLLEKLPRFYWTKVFRFVPEFLRDFVYDLVASLRYRIWGKRQTCRLPTESDKGQMLD